MFARAEMGNLFQNGSLRLSGHGQEASDPPPGSFWVGGLNSAERGNWLPAEGRMQGQSGNVFYSLALETTQKLSSECGRLQTGMDTRRQRSLGDFGVGGHAHDFEHASPSTSISLTPCHLSLPNHISRYLICC